jgi:hypothetical protein
MPAPEGLEHIRAALDELACADAPELVAEARAEARGRVRSMLADALTDSMLGRAAAWLSDGRLAEKVGEPPDAPGAGPHDPPRGEVPDPPAADPTAFYVYGVVRLDDAAVADELLGLWGRSVDPVHEGELAAVVSRVPTREFDESVLRKHLADMGWVEAVARAHEGVLDHLCTRVTVIPMRMCTVYQAEAGVREMLQREATTLIEALEHLDGKREWGVQTFFSRSRAAPASGADHEPADGRKETMSGAAYLARKREERDLDEELDGLIEQAVQEIHEDLAAIAADSALNSPQSREASGNRGDMVLNGVYLVGDEDREAFGDEVAALGSRYEELGLELVITGPWPPYNFLPGSIGATW